MPRANRYILPGCLYHLTHRCHDRKFLFRFAVTRSEYRRRLRSAVREFRVSLLNYCLTSNHTHLLAEAPSKRAISGMMQKLEGEFAEWYNLRKRRNGAFWTDRYHCTLVDGGEHAWNCIKYIDLNMVRAGVVRHPAEWTWCGHDELTGTRSRYRLLDMDAVLRWVGATDRVAFTEEYRRDLNQAIRQGELERDPAWTESVAVGSKSFVDRVAAEIRRDRLDFRESPEGIWTVRERPTPYNAFWGVENAR